MVAIDSSGSMSKEDLLAAVSETNGVLAATGAAVEFCVCDAEVHTFRQVRTWQEAAAGLVGGGGTDFIPVFKAASAAKPKIDVLVFFTDGCGPAPDVEPTEYTTIWCLIGEHASRPCAWGEFVEVDK